MKNAFKKHLLFSFVCDRVFMIANIKLALKKLLISLLL